MRVGLRAVRRSRRRRWPGADAEFLRYSTRSGGSCKRPLPPHRARSHFSARFATVADTASPVRFANDRRSERAGRALAGGFLHNVRRQSDRRGPQLPMSTASERQSGCGAKLPLKRCPYRIPTSTKPGSGRLLPATVEVKRRPSVHAAGARQSQVPDHRAGEGCGRCCGPEDARRRWRPSTASSRKPTNGTISEAVPSNNSLSVKTPSFVLRTSPDRCAPRGCRTVKSLDAVTAAFAAQHQARAGRAACTKSRFLGPALQENAHPCSGPVVQAHNPSLVIENPARLPVGTAVSGRADRYRCRETVHLGFRNGPWPSPHRRGVGIPSLPQSTAAPVHLADAEPLTERHPLASAGTKFLACKTATARLLRKVRTRASVGVAFWPRRLSVAAIAPPAALASANQVDHLGV